MRKNTLYLLALLLVTACAENKELIVFGDANSQIGFERTYKNLGTIKEGKVIKFEYSFTNTGKQPLQILNAVPTCGCVTVSIPKEVFSSKQKGKISVAYNSEGKRGKDKKGIVVQTNLPYPNDIVELSFEAEVKPSNN